MASYPSQLPMSIPLVATGLDRGARGPSPLKSTDEALSHLRLWAVVEAPAKQLVTVKGQFTDSVIPFYFSEAFQGHQGMHKRPWTPDLPQPESERPLVKVNACGFSAYQLDTFVFVNEQ